MGIHSCLEQVYEWMRTPLLSTIYNADYNHSTGKSIKINGLNIVYGAVRFRQIRMKQGGCLITSDKVDCYPYIINGEIETAALDQSTYGTYKPESNAIEFSGYIPSAAGMGGWTVYPVGGYMLYFDASMYNTWEAKIDKLEEEDYIDRATRALQITVNFYNAAANRRAASN